MYTVTVLAQFIFGAAFMVSTVGLAYSLYHGYFKYAKALVIVVLATSIVAFGTLYTVSNMTEQDLVITESGQVTKVIKNVHSVDFSKGGIVTYTYRNGRVGQVIQGSNREVTIENSHEYKEHTSTPRKDNFKNIGSAYQYKPISEYNRDN